MPEIDLIFSIQKLKDLFYKKLFYRNIRGLDRIYPNMFEADLEDFIERALVKIDSHNYKFTPYLERLIPRKSTKPPRVISIASIKDQIILLALKEYLHMMFPEAINRKLPNNYIKEIRQLNINSSYFAIRTDIKNFFPSIDHDKLITKLEAKIENRKIIKLIKRAIVNPTVPYNYRKKDKNKYWNKKGIPQGLSISSILAIYIFN